MLQIIVTTRQGDQRKIAVGLGQTVMQAIRDDGIDLMALCGGGCSCATCHVYVDAAFSAAAAPITADEDGLLEGSDHRKPNSRLSCQIPMTSQLDGLRVIVAPED
jgi:2Fe-2S ferredoxin